METIVLIADDDALQRGMLRTLLERKIGCGSVEAQDGRDCLLKLQEDKLGAIRLVILDLGMPVMDGLETLEIIRQQYPALPVIILTGTKDVDQTAKAMKLGAVDFLTKPVEGQRMAVSIKNALRLQALDGEVTRLKKKQEGTFSFTDMIGADKGLSEAVALARRASASDIPVLITGETGTGKEVLAHAIHGESVRAGKPFIAINCGAIPHHLVESTLFGHEKGAFTGAVAKAAGKFREAQGGTIFLDEVGELPAEAQAKLLRVLQQKEVEPVGAARAVPVDVRIISATNRNLEQEVTKGSFREDLFFRLHVLPVIMPPLRERKEDIPQLVRHFLGRFAASENRAVDGLSPGVMKKLTEYAWPGNVRELENVLHRAMVLCEGNMIGDENVIFSQSSGSLRQAAQKTAFSVSILRDDGTLKTMEDIERGVMAAVLEYFDGNITQAAVALGMAKSTFYRKRNINAG